MSDEMASERPRLSDETRRILASLQEDVSAMAEKTGQEDTRFHGPNSQVSHDRLICEGLKTIRRKKNRGELSL